MDQKTVTDKSQFPFSEMPLSSTRRLELLLRLMDTSPRNFAGTIADLSKLNETWMMRIGHNDECLLNLAYRNGCLDG